MKALIVGSGIGGLSAGIALHLAGLKVTLFDQAQTLEPIGAGIQISPNGMRRLLRWGLGPHLEGKLYLPESIDIRLGLYDHLAFSVPMGQAAKDRWGAPFAQIHRGDLQMALLARLTELGAQAPILDKRLISYEDDPDKITAIFADGSEYAGDILIAADGVHSLLHEQMLGLRSADFTGHVAWRFTVPTADLPKDIDIPTGGVIWTYSDCHVVTTRLRDGQLVNFIGTIADRSIREESWTLQGDKPGLERAFGGRNPFLDALIDAIDRPHRWALFRKDKPKTLVMGRMALLGDAAQAMLPSLAQGGTQAIEDADALAQAFQDHKQIEHAFAQYDKARRARRAKVARQSARHLTDYHLPHWKQAILRMTPKPILERIGAALTKRRLDWIYKG